MRALLIFTISALVTRSCFALYEDGGGNDNGAGVRYLICHSENDCVQISPNALRAIMKDPDTVTDDMEEIINIPDRRSSYLFRSRREDPGLKRSSSYLLRTRKSGIEQRAARGEYLFRTRKSSNLLGDRPGRGGSYLFRTRKSEPGQYMMDRMLRSQGKSYLFRTRRWDDGNTNKNSKLEKAALRWRSFKNNNSSLTFV